MPFAIALALAAAPTDPAFFEALRAADGRLAAIGHRLAMANAPLCEARQPAIGVAVHALSQYGAGEREAARAAFGFTSPVAVEAVVPGAPAARAGVRPDDGLAAVDGAALTGGGQGTADRDHALDLLERGEPGRTVRLTLKRGEATRTVEVRATPACRVRFELLVGRGAYAGADGQVVKLGERYFQNYSDGEIAVVVAHELAHVILRHRERLDAAGVDRGIARELGRNGRLFRRTEKEADELSVALLANAGYDPLSAARFWRERGAKIDHGIFRARTHPSSRARAEALEAAARAIAAQPKPVAPPLLTTRNQPLD